MITIVIGGLTSAARALAQPEHPTLKDAPAGINRPSF
jgi:hypothetical protein